MVIHFVGSRSKVGKEIAYYRAIINTAKDAGHTIAYDWVEYTYALVHEGKLKHDSESWSTIDKTKEAALDKCDVVIAEITARSFFGGYQIAQAIHLKKPILILTRDRDREPIAIAGFSTPAGFIRSTSYHRHDELKDIVLEFLEENTVETKDLRFNFFLDRQSYNYLRWMSSKTGKTKAQILRSLLQKEMNRDD